MENSNNLKILPTITEENLNSIYSDDYIVKAIKQDNRDFKPVNHPLATYYSAFIDNIFIGAFLHIQHSINEVELHSLLKKSAIKYSRELGNMIIKKTFEDKNITRITANIISTIKTALNYCLILGFKTEGIKRNACYKNGILTDIFIMGIIKSDRSIA